jgi:peptidoglycan hydrolase-like protein with peptidoglycan-binding domain
MCALAVPMIASAALSGCSNGTESALPPVTSSSIAQTTMPHSTTTTMMPATTTSHSGATTTLPVAPTTASPYLGPGSSGPAVLDLQRRLMALHYWLGTPDGVFGDSTEQAVYALQKAAGISRDGLVGPATEAALTRGVVPHPEPAQGYVIDVDLGDDLLMLVTGGNLEWTFNTSTGGGYVYTGTAVADTPTGRFSIYRQVDGLVTDNLGQLWRPKYFDGGFAIHGDAYVPPYPVSHGCVRVSNEAIDWIWTRGMAPIGTKVWVYG